MRPDTSWRSLGRGAAAAAVIALLCHCGPHNLSALGNPGDLCTERSSCTDGSECRQTDDGFRCVGGPVEKAPAPAPARTEGAEDEAEQGDYPVESGGEAGDAGLENEAASEVQEEPAAMQESAGQGQEYLPPSRRRRGDQ